MFQKKYFKQYETCDSVCGVTYNYRYFKYFDKFDISKKNFQRKHWNEVWSADLTSHSLFSNTFVRKCWVKMSHTFILNKTQFVDLSTFSSENIKMEFDPEILQATRCFLIHLLGKCWVRMSYIFILNQTLSIHTKNHWISGFPRVSINKWSSCLFFLLIMFFFCSCLWSELQLSISWNISINTIFQNFPQKMFKCSEILRSLSSQNTPYYYSK